MKLTPIIQLGLLIPVAVLIWLATFALSYHSFTLDIPLTVKNLKSGLAIEEDLTTVNTTIRAKNVAYYQLRTSKTAEAVIDLSFIDGTGNYNVKPQITFDVNDVWLVRYAPDIISISIVPAVSAALPIIVDPVGFPANGYALDDITASPTQVTIIGSASIVNTVQQAYVVVNVAGKQNSYSAKGTPEIRNTAGYKLSNVRFSPATVSVNVVIVKGEIFKTVGLNPVFSGVLPSGYWISEVQFNPPAVTLKSSVKRLDGVNSIKTTAINLVGKTTDFSDELGLEIPTGVSLVGDKLVKVTVKLTNSPFNRKIVLVPNAINLGPNLKVASIFPATVDVMLSGPTDKLDTVDRKTVSLQLDVRSATSGDNTIKITKEMFRLPEGVSVISFEPASLGVALTKTN